MLSSSTQSSVIPHLPNHGKSSHQQRKKRKKTVTLNDVIPDEVKTLQYKALGAYLMRKLGT